MLPQNTSVVGIEFMEDSVELPSFRHPKQAVYVLGAEKRSLSDEMVAKCDHIVKIPMKFCVNVGVAGAIVMYDRLITTGKFTDRPVKAGGPKEFAPMNMHEEQIISRVSYNR